MLTINNTLDGYLKDVEILGNTIQNEGDLADIRSVGDTVEGQELYEIPVVSCVKNLFDGYVETGWVDGSGNLMDLNRSRTNLIKINPNTKYVLSSSNRFQFRVVFYTVNNVYISETVNMCDATKGMIFTTPTNCKYVRFMYAETVENSTSWKIQLEEGIVATPYEPYQEDKLTILSPVQLERVGDVADRIICKDGVWGVEKWINKIPLDVQTLSLGTPSITNNMFKIPIPYSKLNLDNSTSDGGRCITTFGENLSYANWVSANKEGIYIGKTAFGLVVSVDTVGDSTINRFNDYFKNKNHYFYRTTENPQFIPLPHDQQIKLRTFANKTNISFLTEIEGAIKAQVPKSLGATVNTHTEQINNLNKELDRVKKLEESTVSTVTTESDFTTVEATSNGYFEDVKLEGKTLVNLTKNTSYSVALGGLTSEDYILTTSDRYLKFTKTNAEKNPNWIYVSGGSVPFELIKPNTQYTIKLDKHLGVNQVVFQSSNGTNSISSSGKFDANGCALITTKDNIDKISNNIQLIYLGVHNSVTDIEVSNIVILEGDHTQNPPSFFEGLKSVGQSATTSEDGVDEIVVSSVNKNLFDDSALSLKLGASVTSDYIPFKLKHKEICYMAFNEDLSPYISINFAFRFCDKNKKEIQWFGFSSNENNLLGKTCENFKEVEYIQFFTNGNMTDTHTISNFVITEDNTKLVKTYIPYQSDKKRLLYYNEETQTWEKPILREWDSIEKHSDGKYYYHQRSGEVVLNGSEDWSHPESQDGDNTILFYSRISDAKISQNYPICDMFNGTYLNVWDSTTDIEGILINHNKDCILRLNKTKLSTQDIEGFKQWLQTNNVTVVYQLAQEKVYECTNIDLITYSGETNYIVESGAIVPKSILKVHNNISNVVKILQEKVSLLENKFIEGLKKVLAGDMYSLAELLYPEDFVEEDSENKIMLLPFE